MRVARRIRTGQVDVNGGKFNPLAPFGGYKQSGDRSRVGHVWPGRIFRGEGDREIANFIGRKPFYTVAG